MSLRIKEEPQEHEETFLVKQEILDCVTTLARQYQTTCPTATMECTQENQPEDDVSVIKQGGYRVKQEPEFECIAEPEEKTLRPRTLCSVENLPNISTGPFIKGEELPGIVLAQGDTEQLPANVLAQVTQFERTVQTSHVCTMCGTVFHGAGGAARLFRHVMTVHLVGDQAYMCKGDEYVRIGREGQRVGDPEPAHVIRVADSGLDNKRFQCDLCGYRHNARTRILEHIASKHDQRMKQHKCPECFKCFAHASYMRKHHQMKHMQVEPYSCERCSFSSANEKEYRDHARTSHSTEKIQCGMCKRKLVSTQSLERHMRYIHQTK